MTESELRYTADHEWVRIAGSVATVGITAYAAGQLGDIVYLELPDPGTVVSVGTTVGEIESTKSVGELIAPLDGTVLTRNEAVADAPELVNSDPLGAGWLITVQLDTPEAFGGLLGQAEYDALIGA